LLEINPLVVTARETLVALDAKMEIDDNALFLQKKHLTTAHCRISGKKG